MSRMGEGARAFAIAAIVLFALVIPGAAAAADGPVLLTGLPLGAIDTPAPSGLLQLAQNPAAQAEGDASSAAGGLALDVNVVAKQLDIARQPIQPSLGASVYDFGRQAIADPAAGRQPAA